VTVAHDETAAEDREPRGEPAAYTAEDRHRFEEFWRDEVAAAALYRELAEVADDERARLFHELAETEDRHADHWAGLLREAGVEPVASTMPWRSRTLVLVARRFGIDRILPAVIRSEAADRDRYREVPAAPPAMADEEAAHGRALALASAASTGAGLAIGEARHRTAAGGSLRAAVFGANDGLVSNLALIMGVAGGTGNPQIILLAGVAGLVAGAGSMAAGEWVSVQSMRELYQREIAVERWELEHAPEEERRELELIYRAKGIPEEEARALADRIMADPATALDTLAREELGLDPGGLASPWPAAFWSFIAFASGAFVPLLPFVVTAARGAIAASAALSAVALATVGVVISVFTGRAAWWSALRMILIGGGAAIVTYGIGVLVGVTLD
jgi:vacuolar iron transporter family protein